MRMPRKAIAIFLAALLALPVLAVLGAPAHRHGASFVVIAAGMQGPARRAAGWSTTTVSPLTPLITHAEVDHASTFGAIWRLIDFWTSVLDE